MAEAHRMELLSAISNNDMESLRNVSDKLLNLKDTIDALTQRQKAEMWDNVLGMCTGALLQSDNDEAEEAEATRKTQDLLLFVTRLANATLTSIVSCSKKDNDEDNDERTSIQVPSSLHETAIFLHEILPTLKSERSGIKNTLCQLFEAWWSFGVPGKEELMANTLLYLLERSTQLEAAKADVSRVMAIHNVLLAVDLTRDSAAPLVSLLLQCSYHPHYLNSPQGVQFLSFLFSLNQNIAKRLHDTIKVHLPSLPATWGYKYGDIYYRAWQKSSPEQREYLEQHCIQDIMHKTCHLGYRNSLWNTLFNILKSLHAKKTQRDVLDMLTKLYGPILWRSLNVCNTEVRLSALQVFFDVFPLANSAQTGAEADRFLQKQLNMMHSLIKDSVPIVRQTSTLGVGRMLCFYWELIPPDVIKCFMTTLVETQIYDSSSPGLREAVLQVLYRLCDNHLAIPYLEKTLPKIGNFIHDNSERVRLGMLDLLLRVRGLRCGVKFYQVVPVEHLLKRLEVDTSKPVVRRLMQLLYRSFVPLQDTPQQQLERIKAMILTNPAAARNFFLELPDCLDAVDASKYVVLLCRYLIESARQLNADNNNSDDGPESLEERVSNDGEGAEGGVATDESDTPRSGAKRSRLSQGQENEGDEDCLDRNKPEPSQGPKDREVQQMTQLLRGITEGVYLMYVKLRPLISPINAFQAMSESMAKKLSVTVREVMAVSQDPVLDSTLISLAGLLPSQALPMVSQSLVKRLYRCRPPVGGGEVDATCIVKSLVQLKKAHQLVETLKESFEKVLADKTQNDGEEEGGSDPGAENAMPARANQKRKKKAVGFSADVEEEVLPISVTIHATEVLLVQPECRRILAMMHRDALNSLAKTLSAAMLRLQDTLSPNASESSVKDAFSRGRSNPSLVSTYVKFYELHLRVCAFLSLTDERNQASQKHKIRGGGASPFREMSGRSEADSSLVTALTWCTTCLLPWLRSATSATDPKVKKGKNEGSADETIPERRRRHMLELLITSLRIASNVMIAGRVDGLFLDEVVQLCVSTMQFFESTGQEVLTNLSKLAVSAALGCAYQLLSVRIKEDNSQESSPKDSLKTQQELAYKRERCADIACSCLCLLFKALTVSSSPSEQLAHDQLAGDVQVAMATMELNDGQSSVKSDTSRFSFNESQLAEIVKSVAPTATELIIELTKPGLPISVSQKVAAALFRCVLADIERAYERDNELLDKEEAKLPALSTMILAAVKRKTATLKMFCVELENSLSGDEVFNIYQVRTLLAIVQNLRLSDPVLQTPVIYQALRAKVTGAAKPPGMDDDVFKDIQSTAESAVKNLMSKLLGEA